MKKYLENMAMVTKSEQKITADLSGSALCHQNAELRKLIEEYHSVTSQVVILLLTKEVFERSNTFDLYLGGNMFISWPLP
jgi:ferritin-like metal-binding protein YciE